MYAGPLFGLDRLARAVSRTGPALDASRRIDLVLAVALRNRADRAGIFASTTRDARITDNICHGEHLQKKILFPNAHCAYNTTAHNLRCYKPILPQSRENASENTSKVFWQIKKTWPAFLFLCLILCLRALMTLANHAHFIFMVKFSGGLILLRRYLKHTSQKIYLNHSSAAFLRAHD